MAYFLSLVCDVFREILWQLYADIFYHLRGIILCDTKRLQFNKYKKQKLSCTVQKVLYSTMSSFFKFDWSCWFHSFRTKKSSLWQFHYRFLWLLDNKFFLQELDRVLWLLIWKNLTRPLFIFNIMFMFGYYNEFTFVWGKIICQLFLKDN